jgi:hypothetical protein
MPGHYERGRKFYWARTSVMVSARTGPQHYVQ